jgi:hypothetical protein
MKTPRSLQSLIVVALMMVIGACAMSPRSGPSALVGTWTNPAGTVWTIRENWTFEVDLDKDGKRDAWGKYSVDGDVVTLMATGGLIPKGCKGKGLYHFSRTDENKLQFTLVSDACKLRRKNVLMGWRRK